MKVTVTIADNGEGAALYNALYAYRAKCAKESTVEASKQYASADKVLNKYCAAYNAARQ